ncbi:MAG: ABC transporter permease [Desulfobacterales bacterium]|nr:ABC transporter permease [Desulfobacterales bacterium]
MSVLTIRKRQETLGWNVVLVYGGALVLSLIISAAMLLFQGNSPLEGLKLLLEGAFGSSYAIEDCLVKAVPIYLCSLGVAIAFRLQIWNIGAEGQFALGAIGATWVAITFPGHSAWVMMPAMMVAASLFGGIWGMIPAVLKLKTRANEIIVTLMLNYIAILILDYLVYGSWKSKDSFGFPMTDEFTSGAVIGHIGETNLNWGILLCLISGILIFIFFRYTLMGYELKASGENVRAAKYARFPYERLVIISMILSGAFAGWAGWIEASATLNRLQPTIMVGYGYTAIVVAWLARLNPLYIGISSFLLAGLRVGVENLQLELQIPAAFGEIMEGLILLTILAGTFFVNYRFERRRGA